MADNYFIKFASLDLSEYESQKNNLDYLPWAVVWEELKKVYPTAKKIDYPQVMDEFGNTRFWHDDGKSGWVELGIEIEGHEEKLQLAVMNHANKAIPADEITSVEANKTYMRCLVKVLALHGIGLYLYRKEDVPVAVKELEDLRAVCLKLITDKSKLSADCAEQVKKVCLAADEEANGDPRLIEDPDVLKALKRKLLAIRKPATKKEE